MADEIAYLVVGILIGLLGGIPLGYMITSLLKGSPEGVRIKSTYQGKEIVTDLLPMTWW